MKANVYAVPEVLSDIVERRGSISAFADDVGVTRHTVRNALSGHPVSAGFIAGVLRAGIDFATVFEIRPADVDRLTA